MKSRILLIAVIIVGSALFTSSQLLKTQLRVTVLDNHGNYQEDADVTLYGSLEDFNKSKNPVMDTEKTDSKGRVRFVGLEPQAYFVEVEKGELSNVLGGEKTDTLKKGRVNRINIVID